MSKVCQEKFQINYPPAADDNGNTWVTDKSARVKKGLPGREGFPGGDRSSKAMNNAVQYNSLPPGMDLEDQELTDQRVMPSVMSGETDVSHDWNREAVTNGFTRRAMRPTDDMYTNEHCDLFYAEITVDGHTGFIERGNTLDRL